MHAGWQRAQMTARLDASYIGWARKALGDELVGNLDELAGLLRGSRLRSEALAYLKDRSKG